MRGSGFSLEQFRTIGISGKAELFAGIKLVLVTRKIPRNSLYKREKIKFSTLTIPIRLSWKT